MLGKIRVVFERLRDRGGWDTAKWTWSQIRWRFREWSLNIETAKREDTCGDDHNGDAEPYVPIPYAQFECVMESLPLRPGEDVFLDYGCGKGRAIVLAGMYSFLRVIGVEMSAELCQLARKNIQQASPKLACSNIEVHHVDAADYEVPADVTVIFFCKPFGEKTLAVVLDNIQRSLCEHPRNMTIVHAFPEGERDVLAEFAAARETYQVPSTYWTGIDVVVHHYPASTACLVGA